MSKLSELIAPSFYSVHKDIKENRNTHYWLAGGRGSTKSSFAGIEIILGIMKDPEANAVAIRKVKETLKESVYEQLLWAIDALGVSHLWHDNISPLGLTYLPTGQKIIFRGADKPKKVKSGKLRQGYFKYVWYEEIDEFNGMEEIRIINQTFLRGGPKFFVFYSYNPPKSKNNWVNTEVTYTRKDRLVHHSTYLTVPEEWLGKQFIHEAETLKELKPKAYEHEYLGEVTGTGGEVFENVKIREITDEEITSFEVMRRGVDYGFAKDPFAYMVMAYNRKYKQLYIFYEIYEVGLSNTLAIDQIKRENVNNEQMTGDSAEPKSLHEFRQHGLKIIGAKKGPDSVEYGIKFLQDLNEIVIDDKRCPNAAWEFLNYELEKDANGNFKSKFPDENNHAIDAVRYAMNYECMKFKDEQQKRKDPDNPTPEERHKQAIREMTGGEPPVSHFTDW